MKCLNCQKTTNSFLCDSCLNNKELEKVLNYIIKREIIQDDNRLNTFIEESTYEERCDCFSILLKDYKGKNKEYYNCKYLKMIHSDLFEEMALKYLDKNDFNMINSQDILYDLLNFYFRNDFITPQKWYNKILNENSLCYELYINAAEYFSMIGDYEESKFLLDKIEASINELNVLYSRNTKENIINSIRKIRNLLERYRNGKPYWPNTEERRKKIATIYDEKGINYKGTIKVNAYKKNKIKEDEFALINECDDYSINSYCSFWCNYVEGIKGIKDVYELAAIKVVDGVIVNEFKTF